MINPIRVAGACVLCVVALTGCSGIGDGSRPTAMTIIETSDLETRSGRAAVDSAPGSGFALTCMAKQLQALVEFSDGQIGPFSERATWSSSDPSVVDVTNSLESELPGVPGAFLPAGLLLPASAGTARITAEFQSLVQTFDVTVTAIDANSYQMTGLERTMAPTTSTTLGAQILDGGEVRDASGNTRFVLDNPAPQVEDLVVLDSEGSLSILPLDATDVAELPLTFTIRALPIVPLASCQAIAPSAVVRIDLPTSFDIAFQDNFYGPSAAPGENRMVRGFSQALKATANFADLGDGSPTTQEVQGNLSAAFQVQPDGATDCSGAFDENSTSPPSQVIGFGNPLFGQSNILTALAAGDALVCSRLGDLRTDADEFVDASNSLTVSVVPSIEDATDTTQLDSIVITPASATLDDFREQIDFSARANFTLADASTLSQIVSREVLWTIDSDNSTGEERRVAEITNSSNSLVPGRAVSILTLGDAPTTTPVNVSATIVLGGALDDLALPPVDDVRASIPLTVSVPAPP